MRVDWASEIGDLPDDATGRELAMYAAWVRTVLLLETLATDHFPDEEAFHKWIAAQQRINLRRGAAEPHELPSHRRCDRVYRDSEGAFELCSQPRDHSGTHISVSGKHWDDHGQEVC